MIEYKDMFTIQPGNAMTYGVTSVAQGVQFSIYLPDNNICKLKLFKKGRKNPVLALELTDEYKWGSVYFVIIGKHPKNKDKRSIEDILSDDYEYVYDTDKGEIIDNYAAKINGRENWGVSRKGTVLRGGINLKEFDWQGDKLLRRPFNEVIMYQLHVRGYTKHQTSKVKSKGTFAGLVEKLDYIEDLGVNACLFLPCYEFDEVLSEKSYGEPSDFYEHYSVTKSDKMLNESRVVKQNEAKEKKAVSANVKKAKEAMLKKQSPNGDTYYEGTNGFEPVKPKIKINYWGYGTKNTYYFAPKASYAGAHKNPCDEMKFMVREFHKRGIEVLMDIYFSPGTNINLMTNCLRNWVLEYHVDGFRINNDVLPAIVAASDPILSGVKLIVSYWDKDEMKKAGIIYDNHFFAEYNEGFMNDARRFLKSDESMIGPFVSRFYRNPKEYSVINFISHVNGFTLMDLVSYDIKHNEANGENNTDGTDYNYSWNCGAEGFTRKKQVVTRRMKQIRNALVMLLLSQGTPMILAGDEIGNTQYGNNNAYCHDDKTTWIDWGREKTYSEIKDYVKQLIEFRKTYPVLNQKDELMFMDRLGVGMPDISIHSTAAWRADYSNYNRMLGVLLYGDYAKTSVNDDLVALKKKGRVGEADSIYIIFNMYWEAKYFDLPQLPEDREWYMAFETFSGEFKKVPKKKKSKKKVLALENSRRTIVPARSIVVFVGR